MTWRKMADAPDTDDPVLLKTADDIGAAIKRGDEWYLFDIENPENIRFVESPEAWMPYPSPEEAQRMLAELQAPPPDPL